MGKCKTCGKKAGFLKSECNICKEENRKREYKKHLKIKEWIDKFDEFTEDNFLDKDEELKLEKIYKRNNLDSVKLNRLRFGITEHYELYKELHEWIKNKILPKYNKSDYKGVNFLKSEAPFYSINVGYYKEKTKTHYQGGSTGYSFKVAKGFWVRQNAFKGRPIKEEYMNFEGVGELILTNKYLYWKGDKSFRIKLDKLVDITPYKNGIDIMRDLASARPEFFGYGKEINISSATVDGIEIEINEPEHQFEVFCHVASVLHDNI